METIVGIDLGTTNSVVAVMKDNKPIVIANTVGDNTTPSVVAFTGAGRLVGKHAKNQAASNPTKTLASVKRVIGRRVKEIPEASKRVSYTLVGRPDDPVQILVDDQAFMPQQVSAMVLLELKKAAEAYLGHPVTEAVITVPAYFNDGQRQATKKAGELAGLNVRRIINEPTAAALAYGLDKQDQDQKVAVFDLGGGTFDISVLEIGNGVWEVKSTNGDTFLGGDDFDREIVNLLVRVFLNKHGVDLREHPGAMQRLRDAAEKAKHELSAAFESKITLPFLAEDIGSEAHLEFTLTRQKFEEMLEPYLRKIETCCKHALKDAGMKPSDINSVVMVGGSTRIPIVKDLARKIFGSEPDTSVNPDEVVALGAAIQGAIISGDQKGMVLVDVTPLSLGIETENEAMDVLIPRNTAIPCVVKEIYTTTEDEQEEVDVFVYQGESHKVARNRLLGQFVLDGIEPAESGDPQIEVRFAIDANGILQVSAKNLATGSEQNITIKDSTSASEDDIQKLQKAAELDANDPEDEEEDSEEFDENDLFEAAEGILEETTEGLKEFAQVLEPEVVAQLRDYKEQLAVALDSEDEEKVEERLGLLIDLWDEIEKTLESK